MIIINRNVLAKVLFIHEFYSWSFPIVFPKIIPYSCSREIRPSNMCIEITSTASHGKYKHYIPDERAVIYRLIYVAENGTT